MKRRVAVVGATGIAGQQCLVALDGHPWFDVVKLAASECSAGKVYGKAIRDDKTGARRWWCVEKPPAAVLERVVEYLVTSGHIR
jgi:aspartate-semialdehyde dehydrogenase